MSPCYNKYLFSGKKGKGFPLKMVIGKLYVTCLLKP